jgi:NAD(P)-dependent dehydrogenase (short-subunit alcohol dehydrogenase family)
MKDKNKKILILGACGLLGSKLSIYLAEHGFDLIISDFNLQKLETLVLEIKKKAASSKVEKSQIDILDEKSLIDLLESYNFDGLVNCSYPKTSEYGQSFLEISISAYSKHIADHLSSNFSILRSLLIKFQRSGDPLSIVLLGSIYGTVIPKFKIYEDTNINPPIEYSVIKSGLIQLSKYVCKYADDSNFRVNLVSPGGIFDNQDKKFVENYTSETLGKGMLDPDDVIPSIEFLLSDASSFINGQNIVIDDGFSI